MRKRLKYVTLSEGRLVAGDVWPSVLLAAVLEPGQVWAGPVQPVQPVEPVEPTRPKLPAGEQVTTTDRLGFLPS